MHFTPLLVPGHPETAVPTAAQEAFAGLVATDQVLREEILHRAHALWQCAGCPNDEQLDHWLQAEAEVARERQR